MGQLEQSTKPLVKKEIKESLRSILMDCQDDFKTVSNVMKECNDIKEISNKQFRTNPLQQFFYNNAETQYRVLSDTIKKNIEILRNLYNAEERIMTKLLGLAQLQYAIYYTDGNNQIYRILVNELPQDLFDIGKSGLALKGNFSDRKGSNIEKVFSKELDSLRKNQKILADMNSHYNRLGTVLRLTYKGNQSNFDKKVGKNMPEAFENDIQIYHGGEVKENINKHKIDANTAWTLLKMAKGSAPWASGGDVITQLKERQANIQVKAFMNKNTSLWFLNRANATSFTQLEDVGNYLLDLWENFDPSNEEALNKKAEEIYNYLNQDSRWEGQVEDLIQEEVKKKIFEEKKQKKNSTIITSNSLVQLGLDVDVNHSI